MAFKLGSTGIPRKPNKRHPTILRRPINDTPNEKGRKTAAFSMSEHCGARPYSNSSTAARSLRNSSSVACIRVLENSLISRPWTIS